MTGYKIDREYWSKFSFNEQMGNIGSEVGRSIKAYRQGNEKRCTGAMERALDLFDATIELLAAEKSYRLKEVLRAREQYLRLFYDGTFADDADAIDRYFMQYAIAARNVSGR